LSRIAGELGDCPLDAAQLAQWQRRTAEISRLRRENDRLRTERDI
jgi:hypothetical protein